jgi:hypothetical protein
MMKFRTMRNDEVQDDGEMMTKFSIDGNEWFASFFFFWEPKTNRWASEMSPTCGKARAVPV